MFKYEVQEILKPTNLMEISDEQINDHWKLYEGYVSQVNKLNYDLIELTKKGQADSLLYADRRRRYGFEYNGMVLHELYFGNLTSKLYDLETSKLKNQIIQTWSSYEDWLKDFINTGKTRGIGWAILYADPRTGQLINVFVQDHELGHISEFIPILVMDVWEHAYMVDHKAGDRSDYIEAFIKNINWEECEKRYLQAKEGKILKRF
ncbi:superoxide dismutase [Candidatus Dependentiae bacterium]|nr:superoxide dismutase [Candidatus Dependentiae bacterium]